MDKLVLALAGLCLMYLPLRTYISLRNSQRAVLMKLAIDTNSWLYVTDNGATTKGHGYLPYYRNSHFFNFVNKYVKMGEFVWK